MIISLRLMPGRLAAGAALCVMLVLCARAASPPGGDAFLARFRAAAIQPDATALADLTRLPFLFEGKPHGRAAFISHVVPQLFTPKVRQCLAHAKAQTENGRLVLWCNPYGFYMGVVDGQWRWMEFAADGEP